ncbi:PEP-utilizing enzyme, mobile region domain protein [Mycobacterium xenopi 3993]|nr:PEP-utilizing enzyme, mobile region domain protein [Mycobacterium xenopi 3993]
MRSVELTKAAFLTAVDGCRAAATTMGQDLAAAGILAGQTTPSTSPSTN